MLLNSLLFPFQLMQRFTRPRDLSLKPIFELPYYLSLGGYLQSKESVASSKKQLYELIVST
jgi:hypothetical protein